jgi:hypothetical protein
MNIPRFTAEASLCKTRGHYQTTGWECCSWETRCSLKCERAPTVVDHSLGQ